MTTSFARDYHMRGEIAATKDGKILALRVNVLADHGAFNGDRAADQVPGRLLPHLHRLLRPRGGALQGHRRLHQQGARRRRVRLLVPDHRGGVPGRADGRLLAARAGHGPGRAADEEPAPARAVPVHVRRPAGSTTPATTRARCGWRWTWPATTSCAREQAEKRERGELMGIGISFFTEARRRRAAQAHGHPRPRHGRRRRAAGAPDRQGRAAALGADPGPGPRDDVRADRRRGDWASRPRTSRSCTATPTRRRSGWAPTAPARRRCPVRRRPWWPARSGTGPRSSPPRCWRSARTTWSGRRAAGSSRATRSRARRSRRSRMAAHSSLELPEGVEGHLDATDRLQPAEPHLSRSAPTSASWTSIRAPAQVKVRRFIAVDDCGVRINPMIVEGQVHGGLADGIGMALMEVMAFDEDGNYLGGSFMDYLLPTLDGVPVLGAGRDGHAVAAPPDRRQGRRRVGHRRLAGRRRQRRDRRARAVTECGTPTCR